MKPPTAAGFTLAETSITVGIVGALMLGGLSTLDMGGSLALTGFQVELRGCLDQAFILARARGSNVTVALNTPATQDVLPLQVPRGVYWGKPPEVPLPPGMDPTIKASQTGLAHARITVTPRRTATASAWFLHDRRDVLCMRLSGTGRVQLLRWRASQKKWTRC